MKKEDMFTDAMGEIDEKYITEHVNNKEKKPFTWRALKYGTLVAACLVVAVIAITLPMLTEKDIIGTDTSAGEVTETKEKDTEANNPSDKETSSHKKEESKDVKVIYNPAGLNQQSSGSNTDAKYGEITIDRWLNRALGKDYDENTLFAVNAVFLSKKIDEDKKTSRESRLTQYDNDLRELISHLPEEHIKAHGGFYETDAKIERYIHYYLDCPDCFELLHDDVIQLEKEKDHDIDNIYTEYIELARKDGNKYLDSLGYKYEETELTFVNDDGSVNTILNYTVLYLTKEQIDNFIPSDDYLIKMELSPEIYNDEDNDGKVTLNIKYYEYILFSLMYIFDIT